MRDYERIEWLGELIEKACRVYLATPGLNASMSVENWVARTLSVEAKFMGRALDTLDRSGFLAGVGLTMSKKGEAE